MRMDCLFVCAVYTGKNLAKKQQRAFDKIDDAVKFGGECVKRYPRFEIFTIDAVGCDGHVDRVVSFSIRGNVYASYPANFEMLVPILQGAKVRIF